MTENNFAKICRLTDLPNKRGKKFTVNDRDIAVFRVYEKVYAVINICPHNQSQVMYDGYINENLYLACPIHGWQFHLKSGQAPPNCKDHSSKLETFDVKIINDEVWVEVKKKKKKWML